MKRLLIFSLSYHPFVGGAEVAIQSITDRISPDEFAFDLVTLRFDSNLPEVERIGNVTVHRVGPSLDAPEVSERVPFKLRLAKWAFPLMAANKASSLHDEQPYDGIWAMMANHAALGALRFKRKHPHIPYILTLQDGHSLAQLKADFPAIRLIWSTYRQSYLRADRLQVISRFLDSLAREIGYTGPIELIPNGVNAELFSAAIPDATQEALRRKYGIYTGDVLLFTASRLVPSKGVRAIVECMPLLPDHVKLLIAGSGHELADLQRLAHHLGVGARVIWAGHIGHEELPELMRIADIFVRPSLHEGFGNAFVEAMAAGLPIIATPVGGIPDFLHDPDREPDRPSTGLFCDVGDPTSIARQVTRLLDDPELRETIVRQAHLLVRENYEWDRVAEAMRTRVFAPTLNS